MQLTFQIIAVVLGVVTVYFIWNGDLDGVFVSVVLAACSSLLIMRFRAKERISLRKDN